MWETLCAPHFASRNKIDAGAAKRWKPSGTCAFKPADTILLIDAFIDTGNQIHDNTSVSFQINYFSIINLDRMRESICDIKREGLFRYIQIEQNINFVQFGVGESRLLWL